MGVQVLAPGQLSLPWLLHAAEPLESAGVTVGEMIGWRIWRIRNGLLYSYSATYGWLPGQPAQGKPDDYGGSGLWCFKDPGRALGKLGELQLGAMGSVYLWGDVVEHSDGYRAEFAEVRSIDHIVSDKMPSLMSRKLASLLGATWSDDWLLADLRKRYGVGSAKDAETSS